MLWTTETRNHRNLMIRGGTHPDMCPLVSCCSGLDFLADNRQIEALGRVVDENLLPTMQVTACQHCQNFDRP